MVCYHLMLHDHALWWCHIFTNKGYIIFIMTLSIGNVEENKKKVDFQKIKKIGRWIFEGPMFSKKLMQNRARSTFFPGDTGELCVCGLKGLF